MEGTFITGIGAFINLIKSAGARFV